MRKVIFLCLTVFGVLFAACSSNDDTWGDWSKASEFGGKPRTGAVTFKIGETVFVGLGYNSSTENKSDKALRDFWKFENGGWSQVDSFPGEGRYAGVAFVIGNKAYVGTGFIPQDVQNSKKWFKDFYECEYVNGKLTWSKTPIAEYPGGGICDAVAFSLNGVGYVGTGSTADGDIVKDFYSYTPASGCNRIEGFPGDSRRGAVAMTFNDNKEAVICLGARTQSGGYVTDVVRFNPNNTPMWKLGEPLVDRDGQDFDDDYNKIPRVYAVSFTSTLDNNVELGYVATGAGAYSRTCWEYNFNEDRWREVTELIGVIASRVQGVGFSVSGYGYIGLGSAGVQVSATAGSYYKDLWKFTPGIEEDDYNDY